MGSNSIVKTSVFVGTDAQEFDKGMVKVKKDLAKTKSDLQSSKPAKIPKPELPPLKPAKIPKPEIEGLDSLQPAKIPMPEIEGGGGLAAGLAGGATIAALAGAAIAIKGVIAAGKFAIETFKEIGEKIRQTGKDARDLGVSVGGLSKLEYAAKVAGVDVKTLHSAINGLGESMSNLKAPELFAKVGLDFKEISALPIDQQFAKIAGALAQIKDPLERVRQADKIFPGMGAQLAELLPMLDGGEESIKKFILEAQKMGLAISPESVQQMKKIQESTARLSGLWEGLKTRVIMALLPIIEKGAGLMDPLMKSVDTTMPKLYKAFKETAIGFSYLVDILKISAGYYMEYFAIPITQAFAIVAGALQKFLDKLKKIPGVGGQLGAFANMDGFEAEMQAFIKQSQGMAANLKGTQMGDTKKGLQQFFTWLEAASGNAGNNIKNTIDALKIKLIQSINELEKDLKKGMATIGMTSGEAKIWELAQQGASPEMLAQVKELAKQGKAVEAAWSLIQVPPFDNYQRQLEGLQLMLSSGRITWQQYAQGVTAAGAALNSALGTNTVKLPSLMLANSKDAVSAAIQHDIRGKFTADPQQQIKQALYEQKAIQQAQLAYLKQIAANGGKEKEVGVF